LDLEAASLETGMNEFYAIVLYRCLIAIAGVLAIYLGYRLFFVVLDRQGEISIKTGEQYQVKMRDVAPGTFFALFGAFVLSVSLFNPIRFENREVTGPARTPTAGAAAPQSASSGGHTADNGAERSIGISGAPSSPAAPARAAEEAAVAERGRMSSASGSSSSSPAPAK
jgi:hypothetical protein